MGSKLLPCPLLLHPCHAVTSHVQHPTAGKCSYAAHISLRDCGNLPPRHYRGLSLPFPLGTWPCTTVLQAGCIIPLTSPERSAHEASIIRKTCGRVYYIVLALSCMFPKMFHKTRGHQGSLVTLPLSSLGSFIVCCFLAIPISHHLSLWTLCWPSGSQISADPCTASLVP